MSDNMEPVTPSATTDLPKETPKETQVSNPKSTKKTLPPAGVLWPEEIKIQGWDTPIDLNDPLDDNRIDLPVDPAMVANMKAVGVIEPVVITVRKVAPGGDVTPEMANRLSGPFVVDGRRRVMHARVANKELEKEGQEKVKVPYILKSGEDPAKLVAWAKSANRFRVDNGPLRSAYDVRQMMNVHNFTIEDCATVLGASEQTIRNWLTLLDQPKEIREAIEKQEITTTAALMLAPLKDEAQKLEELKKIQEQQRETGKKVSAREVQNRRQERQGRPGTANTPKQRLEKASNQLTKLAGTPQKELTRERLLDELNKLCRTITGKQLAKLGEEDADE